MKKGLAMRAYIGIDPGMTGAIAMIADNGTTVLHLQDMPDDELAFHELGRDLSERLADRGISLEAVFLEKVSAMPKQGVSSTFKFGMSFGMARLWACSLDAPMYFVTPQKWQKVLDSAGGKQKDRSLLFARRRWPGADLRLKKHHNRADALCIAEYGRRYMTGSGSSVDVDSIGVTEGQTLSDCRLENGPSVQPGTKQ